MKNRIVVFIITLCLVLTWYTYSPAMVEWDVVKTLQTKEKPRDVAISAKGTYIFVLTDKGEVLVHSTNGALKGRIAVGESIDGIRVGPREDVLLLTSRKDSTIQPVRWKGGLFGRKDISQFAGQPVRFRFHLKNGSLFSFWVSPDKSGASYGYVAAGGPGFTGATDTVGRKVYK